MTQLSSTNTHDTAGRTLTNAPAESCSGKPCGSCNGQGCVDVNANSNTNNVNSNVDFGGANVGGSSTAVVDQSGAIGGSASSNTNVQGSLNNNVAVSNDVKVRLYPHHYSVAVPSISPFAMSVQTEPGVGVAQTETASSTALPIQVENNAVQNVKVEVDLDQLEILVANLIKVIVSDRGKWRRVQC